MKDYQQQYEQAKTNLVLKGSTIKDSLTKNGASEPLNKFINSIDDLNKTGRHNQLFASFLTKINTIIETIQTNEATLNFDGWIKNPKQAEKIENDITTQIKALNEDIKSHASVDNLIKSLFFRILGELFLSFDSLKKQGQQYIEKSRVLRNDNTEFLKTAKAVDGFFKVVIEDKKAPFELKPTCMRYF